MKSSKVFKTVFLDTLKRYLPVSAVYWGVMLFFYPGVELLIRFNIFLENLQTSNLSNVEEETFAGISHVFQMLTVGGSSIIFSAVLAFVVFSYLHSKRQMDFVGALPVTRRTQFFGRLTGVVAIVIVPLIVCTLIGSMVVGFADFSSTLLIMLMMGLVVIANIFFIGFLAVCSGTVLQMVSSYILINGAFPILMLIIGFYPASALPGIDTNFLDGNTTTLISPMSAVFAGIANNVINSIVYDVEDSISSAFRFDGSTAFFCIWWAMMSVVLGFAIYALVKKRRTEKAQTGYAFYLPNIVIRYVVSLVAGLLGGLILSSIFSSISLLKGSDKILMYVVLFLIGFVVTTALADFIIHLVYNSGPRGYWRKLPVLAAEMLTGVIIFFCITLDVAGVVSYAPKAEDVKSVEYSFQSGYDDESKIYYVGEKENIEKAVEIQKSIISDFESESNGWYILNEYYDTEGIFPDDVNNTYSFIHNGEMIAHSYPLYDFTVKYNLKNGETVVRNYSYPYTEIVSKYGQEILDIVDYDYPSIENINKNDFDSGVLYLNESCLEYENSIASVYGGYQDELISMIKKDEKLVGTIEPSSLKENHGCLLVLSCCEYDEDGIMEIYFDHRYKNTMEYLKKYLKNNPPDDYDNYWY